MATSNAHTYRNSGNFRVRKFRAKNFRVKVTGYREMGVVWNKTFLPFSSSANAQNLLTTLETIVLKRFYRFLVAQETP